MVSSDEAFGGPNYVILESAVSIEDDSLVISGVTECGTRMGGNHEILCG